MDEVIKNLYTLFDAAFEENMNGRGTDITRMVTTFVPDAIQNLQAYEAMPNIKEAEWVYDHWCEFKCSNCGNWSDSKPYKGMEKYCPECGLKMFKR